MLVVIFKARVNKDVDQRYSDTAARMRALALQEFGCLGFQAITEGQDEIALSYWPDEQHLQAWRAHPEHREAQRLGRDQWYASYSVEVARVERSYQHPAAAPAPVPGPTGMTVAPAQAAHLPELHRVIDAVAREGRYLAFTQSPPWEASRSFYQGLLDAGAPYFVALSDGKVVGWCDVSSVMGESRAHVGVLGMGLLPAWRHRGLGRQLLAAAIAKSWSNGLTRIELTVREDNHNAKALYESLGFEVEGLRRRASVIGPAVHDVWAMALLRPQSA